MCAYAYVYLEIMIEYQKSNSAYLIDAYLIEEQSCEISFRSDFKWQRISHPNTNKNKVISNMGSVSDIKDF